MKRYLPLLALILAALACASFDGNEGVETGQQPEPAVTVETHTPTVTPAEPTAETAPEILPVPAANADEPVFISGEIPYTSPFFVDSLAEPFVLLEDQAGFVDRNYEFIFALEGQTIGPVEVLEDGTLKYYLALPAVPQGTLVDVDNNGEEDTGVQIFAVAYWSNTWGGPFLEPRDGYGWSGAHASTTVDLDRRGEIDGGILVVWVPDNNQLFPTGYGDDNMLFTEDDPTAPIPAGYNLVDINEAPFRVWKEARPEITLHEGSTAVKNYSEMTYEDAFDALWGRVSVEYPFTAEKGIDWQALYDTYAPEAASARNDLDFYQVMKAFSMQIPDGHVGIALDSQDFFNRAGGSFGMRLAELSDGRVIVIDVLPGFEADAAGIEFGAEIIEWDGLPVQAALGNVVSLFGPYSTPQAERGDLLIFLTRYPPDTDIEVTFQNPGGSEQTAGLTAEVEYDSLFDAIPSFNFTPVELPIEADVLPSGIGYIRITTFSDDYNLMARLWERHIEDMTANEVPGIIIDVRVNGGGSGGLARDFAGYFFDEEIEYGRRSYFNNLLGDFEYSQFNARIEPGPLLYEGPVAVLVSPHCVSACEGFAYMMSLHPDVTIAGYAATAGAYGEVGRGQYELPGDYAMQFPTGRSEKLDGTLLIEGEGVVPDLVVPVTYDGALGLTDEVLEAAEAALLDLLR